MKIEAFKLERFFAKYEFNVRYQISTSDCESVSVGDVLDLGDQSSKNALLSLHLGYTESQGHPRLRRAVANLYRDLSEEQVLIAAPEEAIFLTLESYLEKDDHVIVMTPSYQSLSALPRSIGCKLTEWPVELQDGRWKLDIDFLADNITGKTKLVILNVPHNPTGLCLSPDEKENIVSILRKKGVLLFADEMYWQLEYDKEVSNIPFASLYENSISLSGLSKSYGLPGLRIGWLASQRAELLEPIAGLKDYTTICSSAPSEQLALIAVENGRRLIQRNMDIIQSNLGQLDRLAQRHPDILQLNRGQGGSIVFPSFRDGRSASKLSEQLISKRSLLMLPGPLFDMPDQFFRIGLGRAGLPEALHIFEQELA